jgi:hypothetical protein
MVSLRLHEFVSDLRNNAVHGNRRVFCVCVRVFYNRGGHACIHHVVIADSEACE